MRTAIGGFVDEVAEKAVQRVIATMRDNLGEQLTVDDMARTAMFSKFHFTRIFQRVTGVSPGRFLSAMRLQRAKQLLISTSMNVADISAKVGYNSVGTFSSRFTRSVGLSPTSYRRLGGFTSSIEHEEDMASGNESSAVVRGEIGPPVTGRHGLVFVGLFPNRVPEGRPVRCAVLAEPGQYEFVRVPLGSWFLMAHSIAAEPSDLVRLPFPDNDALSVGTSGPIRILGDAVRTVDLQLQAMRLLDPPVLMALLDVRRLALRDTAVSMRAGLAG